MTDDEFLAGLSEAEREAFDGDPEGLHAVNLLTMASLRAADGDGAYTCELRSMGNPDFRQFASISPRVKVATNTLAEMRELTETYISYYELGGGNWPMPPVRQGRRTVGHFSYNGRLWDRVHTLNGPEPREVALG